MKVLDFLKIASTVLRDNSILEPEQEAKIILSFVLSKTPGEIKALLDCDLPLQKCQYLKTIVNERVQTRKPLAYLLGQWEFYNIELSITQDVFVPRAETEVLVDTVLSKIKQDSLKFIDIGTGCGCIAIALLKNRPNWLGIATDISSNAIKIAQKNAEINNVSNRFMPVICDTLEPFSNIDLVVSNPPYIASKVWETLSPEVHWEPKTALVPGETGLEIIEKIIVQASNRKIRHIALEFAYNQSEAVKYILEKNGYRGEIYDDYSNNPRVAFAIWKKT